MILLTDHAIERIKKRLFKNKSMNLEEVYKETLRIIKEKSYGTLIKDTGKIKIIKIFYKNYCFVGKIIHCEKLSKEILSKIREKFDELLIIYKDKICKNPEILYENVKGYVNFEKRIALIDCNFAYLIFTFRPVRKKDFNIWILPLKDRFIKRIQKGTKKVEIRKSIPEEMKENDLVLVYSNKIKRIVGLFFIEKILKMKKDEAFEKYKDILGISKADYYNMFKSCDTVFLIFISNFKKIKEFDYPEISEIKKENIKILKNIEL